MATFGKISSSLVNFSTTTTAIENPIAQFVSNPALEKQTMPQRNAPSLNLGLFQSTPYVLTPVGNTSASPDDSTFASLTFSNNITLVTPNTKATQPNNAQASQRVPRYQGSFMDQARGMHGSIIIGHDIATAGFPNGYDSSTANGYRLRTQMDVPNIIMGSYILEGLGSQTSGFGYGAGSLDGNVIIGNGFASAVVDSNLDYVTGGYGYGGIERADDNVILGHNNYANMMRTTPLGYSASLSRNRIFGNDNGVTEDYRNDKGYYVNDEKTQIISERVIETPFRNAIANNNIFGKNNMNSRFLWNSGTVPTNRFHTPDIGEFNNIFIGNSNQTDELEDYNYAGGNLSGNRLTFDKNIVIGSDNQLSRRWDVTSGTNVSRNYIIGYRNLFHEDSQHNIVFGKNWTFSANSGAGNETVATRNICIGEAPGVIFSGTGGTGASTSTSNVFIGNNINASLAGGNGFEHQNVTLIGEGASASTKTAQNEITLGNVAVAALRCNVTTITSLSDARDKTNIEPISNASAFIKDLKPVKFDWNRRDGIKAKEHDMGFLAQDLDDAQSKHGIQDHLDIVYKSNPEALEASYGKLLPILVQALKEQQEEIEKLKSTTN